MKRNFVFPVIVELLYLPCILVPLLISLGLGTVLALIFPSFAFVFIILSIIGFVTYILYQQSKKTR